ncbi:MAG TPA: hypothetical protein VHD62_16660 [Opitutaceae bacterium]|nr:hypothetical protein [Opitutaceae bacterium]
MPDEPDPPRKFYQLKPKEFEAVNTLLPRADDAARVPAPDPGPGIGDNGRITVEELFRAAQMGGPALAKSARPAEENEVHAILRENHAHAEAAGLNQLKPKPRRRSKRTRDYWILLIAGNLFIVTVYSVELMLGFSVQCLAAQMPSEFWNLVRYSMQNLLVFAMAGVGMMFYSAVLTWLMFAIMPDY